MVLLSLIKLVPGIVLSAAFVTVVGELPGLRSQDSKTPPDWASLTLSVKQKAETKRLVTTVIVKLSLLYA